MTGLLLDTSILLRHANGDSKVSTQIQSRAAPGRAWVSAVSIWEIAIKVGIGKLKLDMSVAELVGVKMRLDGIQLLQLSESDFQAYSDLPFPNPKHRDPFDRMLVVQASERGLTLLTSDPGLKAYGKFVEAV